MNIRDLEYLVMLAETGHFGRAAERCHVTQPTLSMQVAKLEAELGVALFERGKRTVRATAAGRAVIEEAAEVLDRVRRIQEIGRAATVGLSGPLYLGVIPTVGPYLLPQVLPELRRAYPEVRLYLREDITDRLLDRMKNGELDAAILSLPLDMPGIEHAVLFVEEFVAALPADHPLAERERLTLSDLQNETILLLEEGNCMRDQTLRLCKGSRPADRDEYRASSIECLRQMVGAGMGCTFLPKTSATGSFANASPVAIRHFASPAPTRDIVVAWRKSHPKSRQLRELAAQLVDRSDSA